MPVDESQPARIATGFATALRRAGVPVDLGALLAFVDALGHVGIDDRQAVYWAGRATLVHRPEHIPPYDNAFAAYWLQREPVSRLVEEAAPVTLAVDDEDAGDAPVDEADELPPEHTIVVRYSPVEILRHKDFAAYSHDEFDEARRLMADLKLKGSMQRTRRLRRSRRSHRGPTDLRRTVRKALRTDGEVTQRAFLEPGERPRRIVLLCDVSGSMESYSRALLRFLHAAVAGRARGRVEAFALGTRLTRLTRELSSHDPDAALVAAAASVRDWSGGTRLGDVMREFNDRWGVRGMARGAIVVILSDGWDRGEPAALAEQMARLHRVAHRVIWVNPLKASPGYAPLARGMAAALPYVDEFVEGHSLASLQELAEVITR